MQILNFLIKNFGSYEELTFEDFNLGLALISGETGSGKSTFLDSISWLLFGETSKDTSVDEVKRWNSEFATKGYITISTSNGILSIFRTRGKVQENDLLFTLDDGKPIRGKNVSETQSLINEQLGFDAEFYFNTTYFHQFSKSEMFFISRPTDRRAVFERIVDQTLAIKIADGASNERKVTKKAIEERKRVYERYIGRKDQLEQSKNNSYLSKDDWDNKRHKTIEEIARKLENFEYEKQQKTLKLSKLRDEFASTQHTKLDNLITKLETLKHKLSHIKGQACPTCGKSDKETEKALTEQAIENIKNEMIRLSEAENPYITQIQSISESVNTYGDQLENELDRINPFIDQIQKIESELQKVNVQIEAEEANCKELEIYLARLNLIYYLSFDLRGALLSKVIKEIEINTNTYLENHFGSQVKVLFMLKDADKLEVELQKDGNLCSYKQLSGGQRTMLKLCFWLATKIAIENKAGKHLNILCFDESFNGLDDKLKEQSFGLLQQLETTHDSIFVIDHQESFKNNFTTEFKAEIIGDISRLERIK